MPTFPSAGITIPDGIKLEEIPRFLRAIQSEHARALANVQKEQLGDPARKDWRQANSLYAQEGPVSLDIANRPNAGDVLYAVDSLNAAWGTPAAPAPTDPGVGPLFGGNNALLDGNHHTDTVAQAVSRGSLIYGNSTPKWDELNKPASPSVLKNDATDAAWVTIPTRRLWLPAQIWKLDGGGSQPDQSGSDSTMSNAWIMGAGVDVYHGTTSEVPDNWVSGTITVKVYWSTATAAAQNWVPHFYWLERVDGDDMTAAGTHITGPTTSANVAADILKITTVGTLAPGSAGRLLRLVMARLSASDANDTYTDDINMIGVELSFTPSY